MKSPKPFNPLDKVNLGKSVADALLQQDWMKLNELEYFNGAGIYAIYYIGDFEAYNRLTQLYHNHGVQIPIYVGKAVPKGARKGLASLEAPATNELYKRLKEHADSIRLAENIELDDFLYRYLVVDDIWIPLGEALLIAKFSPIWNQLIDGFGNHDPGKGRHEGMRPRWDVLHPGRRWANNLRQRHETLEQISLEVVDYLQSSPIIARLSPT